VEGRPVRAPDAAARPATTPGPVRDADLEGRHIVVTAGGTREPIDPVRYIGNRSTGRMGVAIVDAAMARGARVTLIAANVEVPLPDGPAVVRVESAAELRDAVVELLDEFDALVMAAAVADFAPVRAAPAKLERADGLTLELGPTDDILALVGRRVSGGDADPGRPERPILVGFAAETGSIDRAPEKLRRKGVDLLVANDVAEAGSGFGTDTDRVTIFDRDGGRDDLPLLSKREVADHLLDRVARLLDARDIRSAD
jgi:phosphopantothenoylcysteine decarboxylase/phosphopantothenate--cysteine ligase